jgi:hypothetical protein
MMAQCQTMLFFWTERLVRTASNICINGPVEGSWRSPLVSESQAIEQVAGMVDRFNKTYLRTLRGLSSLRKPPLALVVHAHASKPRRTARAYATLFESV